MKRWTALLLFCSVFVCLQADAADAGGDDFAPLYEGAHVLPTLRLSTLPPDIKWSNDFQQGTNAVLAHYGWYLAEVTCLLDDSGQIRETLVTEALPSLNLSATMVDELRRHQFVAALAPNGPAASVFTFRMRYMMPQRMGDLGSVASRLRRAALKGDPGAQYTLSRVMLANVSLIKTDLDSEQLLRSAADPGRDRRAMLAQNKAVALAARAGWSPDALERRLAAYRDSRIVTEEIVVIPAVARVVTRVASDK